MLESTVALLPEALIRAALGQPDGERASTTEPDAAPSGCFRCAGADEWLAVSVRSDDEWRGLCRCLGWQDLVEAPACADGSSRLEAKNELNERLADALRVQPARELERALWQEGVPAARSRHMGELIADDHLKERNVFENLQSVPHLGTLPWMDEEGWRGEYAPAPDLGADNDYVFGDLLGLPHSVRDELTKTGAIR
jgi:benzylsuccinate CoA-transferase BbsF subunit